MEATTKKRRWWQFGLKPIRLLTLLVATYLAGRSHRMDDLERELGKVSEELQHERVTLHKEKETLNMKTEALDEKAKTLNETTKELQRAQLELRMAQIRLEFESSQNQRLRGQVKQLMTYDLLYRGP